MRKADSMNADRTGGTSQRCANPPVVFSLDQIIDDIERAGLDCGGRIAARHMLERVSYHHLKPYVNVVASASSSNRPHVKVAHDLMTFDRRISSVILKYIGVFEAQLKARYSQLMAEAHGPFAAYDSSLFLRKEKHDESLRQAETELKRQSAKNAPGVSAALAKYNGKAPLWIMLECALFGTASKLYSNTADTEVTSLVAASFNLNKDKMTSWARTLNDARNVCAHFNPYIVRKQIPSVPKPLRSLPGSHTSPFYAVPMLEHTLESDALRFGDTNLDYSLRLRQDAASEVADFAELYIDLVAYLGIPSLYVDTTASSKSPH